MIVCDAIVELSQSSVAVQVLVTVPKPQSSRLSSSKKVIVTLAAQLSEAVGSLNTGPPGHSILASSPTPANTGAVVSTTVIVWLPVIKLLQLSVAIQTLTNL